MKSFKNQNPVIKLQLVLIVLVALIGIIPTIFKAFNKADESNKIVFVWEGLESDIPQDGEFIQITGTDENTVYLNSIDE